MSKYVLRTKYIVEDHQGCDPRIWTEEKVVKTFEAGIYHMSKTMWWGGDPITTTTVSFELCDEDGVILLRTGVLFPDNFFEERLRSEEEEEERRRTLDQAREEIVIDDDDMPF